MPEDTRGRFERVGERLSRGLAGRHSRRSFLGGVGRGSLVLAAGGSALALRPAGASAHNSPCREGYATTCHQLTGTNACPSNTCGCGFWQSCGHPECPPHYMMRWRDCCVRPPSWCEGRRRCVSDAPTCYNHKHYPHGCSENVGAIRCRAWECVYNQSCN